MKLAKVQASNHKHFVDLGSLFEGNAVAVKSEKVLKRLEGNSTDIIML